MQRQGVQGEEEEDGAEEAPVVVVTKVVEEELAGAAPAVATDPGEEEEQILGRAQRRQTFEISLQSEFNIAPGHEDTEWRAVEGGGVVVAWAVMLRANLPWNSCCCQRDLQKKKKQRRK